MLLDFNVQYFADYSLNIFFDFYSLSTSDDYRGDDRWNFWSNYCQVNAQQFLSGGYAVTLFGMSGKAFAIQVYGINTKVDKYFCAVISFDADSMFSREESFDNTINR